MPPCIYQAWNPSTNTAQAKLDAKNTQYPQTVNRAVSFNAIKYQALDLRVAMNLSTP